MKFKLMMMATILVITPHAVLAQRTDKDRQDCVVYYQEAQKYVAVASSVLWDVYQTRVIDYDQYSSVFNEIVLRSRKSISHIRERSYVGTSDECSALYWESVRTVNHVLGQLK